MKLVSFVIRRIIYIVVVFFIISIIMFMINLAVPGDQAMRQIQGMQQEMTPAAFDQLYEMTRRNMGLDRPGYIEYLRWVARLL